MLAACVGTVGSGKTAFLVYLLNLYRFQNSDIYTNIGSLKMSHNYVSSYEGLSAVANGVSGISEFWIWADSRSFGTKNNKFVSQVILQSRKDDYDVIYDLQDFGQIDKRIRGITDIIFYCKGSTPLLFLDGLYHRVFYIDVYRKFISGDYTFVRSLSVDLSSYFLLYDTKEKYSIPLEKGENIFIDRGVSKAFIEAQCRKSEIYLAYSDPNGAKQNEGLIDFFNIEESINEVDLCI